MFAIAIKSFTDGKLNSKCILADTLTRGNAINALHELGFTPYDSDKPVACMWHKDGSVCNYHAYLINTNTKSGYAEYAKLKNI